MAPTTIFLTGATGYIGGSVLAKLLEAPAGTYKVSALVRSKEKAPLLESVGVRPVLGSLSDLDILEKEAREHDATIHTASADDLPSALAILKGLKEGGKAAGKKKVLVHTSGTGVLADNAQGEYFYETVYDDADNAQINSLPDTAMHRYVDLAVREASDEVNAHIILPSTIYGHADHALVKNGISNALSIQVPMLIRVSIHRGQAGVIGRGANKWPNVHVSEVAEIYPLVLEAALSGALVSVSPASAPSPALSGSYFFGENGEHDLIDVARAVGEALAAHGIGSREPTPLTKQDLERCSAVGLGTNSRAKATRARLLGWKPVRGTKDFLDSIKADVERILGENPETWTFEPPR